MENCKCDGHRDRGALALGFPQIRGAEETFKCQPLTGWGLEFAREPHCKEEGSVSILRESHA